MKQSIIGAFKPVRLQHSGRKCDICSVHDAAHELLIEWPIDDGEYFYEAVKACLDCLEEETPPEVARSAFVQAALEAGIQVEQ